MASEFDDFDAYRAPTPDELQRERRIRAAEGRVRWPANALLVTGILSCITVCLWVINVEMNGPRHAAQFTARLQTIDADPQRTPEAKQRAKDIERAIWQVGYMTYPYLVVLESITGVLTIAAAIRMKALTGRKMAMLAAVLSAIPCVGAFFLLGIPVGVWVLAILTSPDVVRGFEAAAGTAGDTDAEL